MYIQYINQYTTETPPIYILLSNSVIRTFRDGMVNSALGGGSYNFKQNDSIYQYRRWRIMQIYIQHNISV